MIYRTRGGDGFFIRYTRVGWTSTLSRNSIHNLYSFNCFRKLIHNYKITSHKDKSTSNNDNSTPHRDKRKQYNENNHTTCLQEHIT